MPVSLGKRKIAKQHDMRRTLLYIILLITAHNITAQQNYVFHHLTTADGLSSNFVQSIFQDSKGFYWIGTSSGLQIFDGYTFSKPLLAGKDLLQWPTITETRDGTIWISTKDALYQYNRINKKFTLLLPPSEIAFLNLTVIEDSAGNIWLLNMLELYKYDAVTHKLVNWLHLPPTDPAMSGGAIAYNKDSNLIWIQNGTTLFAIAPAKKKIVKKESMPYQAASMWADGNSFLWIGFWTAYLCRYNLMTGKKDFFPMSFKNKGSQAISFCVAMCFSKDAKGKLWIGTDGGGLWYFDEAANKVLQTNADNLKPELISYDDVIYSIVNDKERSVWVGSDKGIRVFNPVAQQFFAINNADLPLNGISVEVKQPPFETSTGDILIATYGGGWLQYDRHFNFKRNFSVMLNAASSHIDSCRIVVTCFAEDKKGRIWIGHRGGVLGIYEPHTGVETNLQVPEFRNCSTTDIKCDNSGNMWFAIRASNRNLIKRDANSKKFVVYNDSLLWDRMDQRSSILITKQGAIWVQTFGNGIYRFDPLKEKIVEIYRDGLPPYKIPSGVAAIDAPSDSEITVSSYSEGFFLINTVRGTVASLNTNNGLPSNYARAIYSDTHNNYWIAMISDIVRMDRQTKKITSFDEEDGIVNRSFASGFTKFSDGRLFISTNTGLLYFHPDSNRTLKPPPDVIISGLKINSKPVLLDSILLAQNNTVHLSYNQNFLTIDFVSVSYLNRKKNNYFYKLQGLTKNWVEAGTQRSADFTNLNPGNYTFMVKCVNRDGVYSRNITYLHFIISPPWWLTWWAYFLYILLASVIVYSIYRNRIQSLKKTQELQIKAMVSTQEEERKRISRDLHDDVGTKLSALKLFISTLKEKASNSNDQEIKILANSSEKFITEAMQDVRQLLLNLSPTILEEFGYTTAVESLVNKINETKQIAFTLVVFGMKHRMKKDYELALYRITQELINNVLKHAAAKNVSLQIGHRDNKIILMMEDDGKGFDITKHRDGYGLNNLDVRTKLMHGTLNIDSLPGKGTSVLIEIPYIFV
ncbi:two-component regulator propeller domain-containing protein [soil metagenome]